MPAFLHCCIRSYGHTVVLKYRSLPVSDHTTFSGHHFQSAVWRSVMTPSSQAIISHLQSGDQRSVITPRSRAIISSLQSDDQRRHQVLEPSFPVCRSVITPSSRAIISHLQSGDQSSHHVLGPSFPVCSLAISNDTKFSGHHFPSAVWRSVITPRSRAIISSLQSDDQRRHQVLEPSFPVCSLPISDDTKFSGHHFQSADQR